MRRRKITFGDWLTGTWNAVKDRKGLQPIVTQRYVYAAHDDRVAREGALIGGMRSTDWKCERCGDVNADPYLAYCANCGKKNPSMNPYRPDTPKAVSFNRMTCPGCGYSNTSGRETSCYACGKSLRGSR